MKNSTKRSVGVGVAALVATAAAAYFLTGKGGAKNRKKVATWAKQIKKEVVKRGRQSRGDDTNSL